MSSTVAASRQTRPWWLRSAAVISTLVVAITIRAAGLIPGVVSIGACTALCWYLWRDEHMVLDQAAGDGECETENAAIRIQAAWRGEASRLSTGMVLIDPYDGSGSIRCRGETLDIANALSINRNASSRTVEVARSRRYTTEGLQELVPQASMPSGRSRGSKIFTNFDTQELRRRHSSVSALSIGQRPVLQVGGHKNSISRSECGGLVKQAPACEIEAYQDLQRHSLRKFMPRLLGSTVNESGVGELRIEDLTSGLISPCVMDIKMGSRTFLESEVTGTSKLRTDLAQKMVALEPNSLTEEELTNGITKLRYMRFREERSSTAERGWRISGIHTQDGHLEEDCTALRSTKDLTRALRHFLQDRSAVRAELLRRLETLRTALDVSEWFATHEVVGTSILFVYDAAAPPANIAQTAECKMIDFAKTVRLPEGVRISHRSEWVLGNNEDGYLSGLENLLSLWKTL